MPKTKHGMARSPVYKIWAVMKDRCCNPKNPRYSRYGGRGIRVCDDWHDFTAFVRDMGIPVKGMSLDRIDNDKGYYPENCRWATMETQYRNRSTNVFVTYNGVTLCLADWARKAGVNRASVSSAAKARSGDYHEAVKFLLERKA